MVHLVEAAGAGYALCRVIDVLLLKEKGAVWYAVACVFLAILAAGL